MAQWKKKKKNPKRRGFPVGRIRLPLPLLRHDWKGDSSSSSRICVVVLVVVGVVM
jgi:hypothetical protein